MPIDLQARRQFRFLPAEIPFRISIEIDSNFDRSNRVPGEIKRSRDLRGGRWSWAKKVGLPLLELSKLFVNSSATNILFVTLSKHSS